MKHGDMLLAAYVAADNIRRRRRAAGERVTELDMARWVSGAYAMQKRFRSIHRVQVNRDKTPLGRYGEWIDLGGEG